MSDELKPCPFCGHADGLDHWEKTEDWEADLMYVTCLHCDITISSSAGFGAEKWNTRPVEDALRAENAALKAQWANVPWSTLNHCLLILNQYNMQIQSVDVETRLDEAFAWLDANAPKEEPHP